MKFTKTVLHTAALACVCAGAALVSPSFASSHREAPFITTVPKADNTDFYMFRSYESGRTDYVTLISNYVPLQDAYGGPNYFKMDPNALYEMHVDNNGDAKEDITFQFRFNNTLANAGKGVELAIGGKMVAIPLTQAGGISAVNDTNSNVRETFTVNMVRGDRRKGAVAAVPKTAGGTTFDKPVDYIGVKTFGNAAAYETYANQHVHSVNFPGCPAGKAAGKVFVGQRQEGFAVNLGPIFDLVNATAAQVTNPALINAFAANSIQDKNITTMAIEIHKDCLTAGNGTGDPVIGAWTTASMRQGRLLSNTPASGHQTSEKAGGAWVQVSRLGNPLVNEVVIGLRDKDKFNGSHPSGDTQFLDYVSHPTLPALLNLVLGLGGGAPTNFPRTDLITTFLTGITGVNKPTTPTPSEMLRLNTAIAPVAFAQQNRLGVAGEVLRVGGVANLANAVDLAGFPNGRRPKDDVVDIALVAVMGGLCVINGTNNALALNGVPGVPSLTSTCAASSVPLGGTSAALHDGVDQAVVPFLTRFPYLNTPLAGSQ